MLVVITIYLAQVCVIKPEIIYTSAVKVWGVLHLEAWKILLIHFVLSVTGFADAKTRLERQVSAIFDEAKTRTGTKRVALVPVPCVPTEAAGLDL